jgi:type II secretory pathway pseudopilin PulG
MGYLEPRDNLPKKGWWREVSILGTASFTLIELLASMAILLTIVFILLSAFNSASNIATLNQRRVELNQISRAVLDQISRDIQRAASLNNVISAHLDNAGIVIAGVTNSSLFLLCDILPPDPNPYGSLVNIGYQVAYTNVGGILKFALERGDDAGVVTTGLATGTCAGQQCSNSWWNLNCCTTTADTYWKLFSENVIGIQFYFYTNYPSASSPGSGIISDDSFDSIAYTTTWSSNALPSSVGVWLYTIDSVSYNRALRISPNLSSSVAVGIITNNMRSYFTRIYVPRSSQTQ